MALVPFAIGIDKCHYTKWHRHVWSDTMSSSTCRKNHKCVSTRTMTLILDVKEVFLVYFQIMASYVHPSLPVFCRRSCLVFSVVVNCFFKFLTKWFRRTSCSCLHPLPQTLVVCLRCSAKVWDKAFFCSKSIRKTKFFAYGPGQQFEGETCVLKKRCLANKKCFTNGTVGAFDNFVSKETIYLCAGAYCLANCDSLR